MGQLDDELAFPILGLSPRTTSISECKISEKKEKKVAFIRFHKMVT